VAAGDLLNLDGLKMAVDAVEVDPGDYPVETENPPACAIEMTEGKSIRVSHDLLIGSDSCCHPRLASTLEREPLSALITFAAGNWHLHDLNGNSLFRNGKPEGRSLVLNDGDCIRIADKYFRFRIGAPADAGRATAVHDPNDTAEEISPPPVAPPAPALPAPLSQEIDIDVVYQKAKKLWEQLLPVLRDPGRTFQPRPTAWGGLRGWLRIFRRPGTPEETLDRLQFLLSGSPRDRVWLYELARFFSQQAYTLLCLQVLKELCRLYPHDVTVRQTLAKFYYQQGRNPRLPAPGRLIAIGHSERCTQLMQRLAPNDPVLNDLQRAIRVEQTILRHSLEERTPCAAPFRERAEAIGRMG
jgi:hypothetical protein